MVCHHYHASCTASRYEVDVHGPHTSTPEGVWCVFNSMRPCTGSRYEVAVHGPHAHTATRSKSSQDVGQRGTPHGRPTFPGRPRIRSACQRLQHCTDHRFMLLISQD